MLERLKNFVVPVPSDWLQAYDYTVAGHSIRFDQSAAQLPILHLTLFNRADDHYGLSPMEVAAIAVGIHNAGAKNGRTLPRNLSVAQNASSPRSLLYVARRPGDLRGRIAATGI